MTENLWSAKPKIFMIWFYTENVANPGPAENFHIWTGFMIFGAFALFSFQRLICSPFLSQKICEQIF